MATVTISSSGNWSSFGIANGDDVVINAATVTLDSASQTCNSVTFNNASARLAISGSVIRELIATNGFSVAVAWSAALCGTLTSGQDLTFRGKWVYAITTFNVPIANSSGGNLTLTTIGADASLELVCLSPSVENTNISVTFCTAWTSGTLTTVGVIRVTTTYVLAVVTMTGGTWSHTHTGTGIYGSLTVSNNARLAVMTGSAVLQFSGNMRIGGSNSGGGFVRHGSGSVVSTVTGDFEFVSVVVLGSYGYYIDAGAVTHIGSIYQTGSIASIAVFAGMFYWKNQSVTVPAGKSLSIYVGSSSPSIDLQNLLIANSGRVVFIGITSGVISVTGCVITNQTSSANASAVGGNFDNITVVNVPSDAPTLPAVNKVELGTSYGYSGAELIGTALQVDNTVLAAAVSAALEAIHLHKLLASAYDPASKPGNASGLLNVLVENDDGVPRFTANSLEQGSADLTPVLEVLGSPAGDSIADDIAAAAGNASSAATNTTDLPSMIETSGGHQRLKASALEAAPSGGEVTGFNDAALDQLRAAEIELGQWDPATEPAQFYLGCDHLSATGNAFTFTNPDGTWPDLTDKTVRLEITVGQRIAIQEGTVVVATGANQSVMCELLRTQMKTLALAPGFGTAYGTYAVIRIDSDGSRFPLTRGIAEVIDARGPE